MATTINRRFLAIALAGLLLSACGDAFSANAFEKRPPARGVSEALPREQGPLVCHVDVIGPIVAPGRQIVMAFAGRALRVAGWAIDQRSRSTASAVDVVIDGVPYAALYGVSRKDVAAFLKDKRYELSGFDFTMPGGVLAAGDHTMSIRVVRRDGKSFLQSPESLFVLVN